VTIADIVNLYTLDSENQELLRRAIELPALPSAGRNISGNDFGMPTPDLAVLNRETSSSEDRRSI
jgi:hypothetical protein